MKKLRFILLSLLISGLFISCASNSEIPTYLTSSQLIQKAQSAYDRAAYKEAIKYYQTTINRYGTDLSIYVEATYEIGHIYLRTKKYEKAYPYFAELKDIYSTATFGSLPTAYDKLADIGISQIPEKKYAAIIKNTQEENDSSSETSAE
ncbi:MAG: hypothetical protein K5866_02565 [Treponema sp.]|nr:hypothetical protein [Treponema sp.]